MSAVNNLQMPQTELRQLCEKYDRIDLYDRLKKT